MPTSPWVFRPLDATEEGGSCLTETPVTWLCERGPVCWNSSLKKGWIELGFGVQICHPIGSHPAGWGRSKVRLQSSRWLGDLRECSDAA